MTSKKFLPAPRDQIIDLEFQQHRAKLIDIAAFLDRIERAPGSGPADFRITAFQNAIALLTDGKPERARRVLQALSDPTEEPIASAAGMKGAYGAWPGKRTGERK